MAVSDFVLSVQLSDGSRFDALVTELATTVVRQAGCEPAAGAGVVAAIRQALAEGASRGAKACELRFHAEGGEMHVAVSFPDGGAWQTRVALT